MLISKNVNLIVIVQNDSQCCYGNIAIVNESLRYEQNSSTNRKLFLGKYYLFR
jgi:hypothetical protein